MAILIFGLMSVAAIGFFEQWKERTAIRKTTERINVIEQTLQAHHAHGSLSLCGFYDGRARYARIRPRSELELYDLHELSRHDSLDGVNMI